LDKVAGPVIRALARRELKRLMPVEHHPKSTDREQFTYLEALARTLAGIAPWLELDGAEIADDRERALHAEYRALASEAIAAGVLGDSPDRVNFEHGSQPIVDAAFLAHAVLRAPRFFASLPPGTREVMVNAFKSTRDRKPHFNNWLLFSAMIECALRALTGECDLMRIDYAVRQHDQWYKGGGIYGDGPNYHADYYNSFVIQPMLIDVLRSMHTLDAEWDRLLPIVIERGQRYAQIQERLISPDGTYPATGRSIVYRCGAFQHLAQMALQQALPNSLKPAQVRRALSAVIKRTLDAPETFDAAGWLRIGLSGHQPSLGETYISTGSLYLCMTAFLPLGLPPADPFWSAADAPFTGELAWSGADLPADHG